MQNRWNSIVRIDRAQCRLRCCCTDFDVKSVIAHVIASEHSPSQCPINSPCIAELRRQRDRKRANLADRFGKRIIYPGNEMTKSEQQTFRITRVYLHGNGSAKGLYVGACSLDREKVTRESRDKEARARRAGIGRVARPVTDSIFPTRYRRFFFPPPSHVSESRHHCVVIPE